MFHTSSLPGVTVHALFYTYRASDLSTWALKIYRPMWETDQHQTAVSPLSRLGASHIFVLRLEYSRVASHEKAALH